MVTPAARRATGGSSSFSRNQSSPATCAQGVKRGQSGATFVSSGISDLDKILGGGFLLGSLVLIAEDPEAPHHLLLLRNFISQGLVHYQPLLFASPSKEPRAFLGTLPAPALPSQPTFGADKEAAGVRPGCNEQELRIAWQYKKYFGDQQSSLSPERRGDQEYCSDFDLKKPVDRHFLASHNIQCVSLLESKNLDIIYDQCSAFLARYPRNDSIGVAGRIAIQSLCAPQCMYSDFDWEMLSFLMSLRAMIQSSNTVAVVTFPISVLRNSVSKRWQHLADTLLSVRAIPDDDKDLAKLLTGYQEMIGLLHVHKVAQTNSQAPVVLEATTFSLKLQRRKYLVLERLNQAPVDGTPESSHTACGSSGSSTSSVLDF